MGFSTYDEIIAALTAGKGQFLPFNKASITTVASTFYSMWANTGIPAAGEAGTAIPGGNALYDYSVGALIPLKNPTAPATLHALQVGVGSTIALGSLILIDRLVHCANISATSTSPQTVNSVPLPRYTDGKGVMMILEVTTALGASASNVTITYTNQDGVPNRSTGAIAMTVSSPVGRLQPPAGGYLIPLQAGDYGVRSVETIQFSASMAAGVVRLLLYKLIEMPMIPVMVANDFRIFDLALQTPSLPRIYDDACLSFLLLANTTTSPFFGYLLAAEN